MKHRVADLMSPLLDAAVATAEGCGWHIEETISGPRCMAHPGGDEDVFRPSVSWQRGGPIIEAKRIALRHLQGEPAEACVAPGSDYDTFVPRRASYMTGPTVMIAAMRAYVHSFSGDEIDLPDRGVA